MWYARFWSESERRYAASRALHIEAIGKKGRKDEASAAAFALLEAINPSASTATLMRYVTDFWQEDSPYSKEREQIEGRKLSAHYIKSSQIVIRLYLSEYAPFANIRIDDLTAGALRDFRLWAVERGVSSPQINRCLQVLRVPVRYAIARDEAKADPFSKIKPAFVKFREKGILTRDEVLMLLSAPVSNIKHRLAVALGILCGLRLGEVRGLLWKDIEVDKIHVRHNWQDMEGLKPPKCNSYRDVPIVPAIALLLDMYRGACRSDAFLFSKNGKIPLSAGFFRLALKSELSSIGIFGEWTSKKPKPEDYVNNAAERNITVHSLRHTFVSLCRLSGMNDFEVQALVGHKSSSMMDRYSHPCQAANIESCAASLTKLFT
jgi:integrase